MSGGNGRRMARAFERGQFDYEVATLSQGALMDTNEARKAHQATCAHLWGPESMRYRQCVRCGLGWHTNDPAPRESHHERHSEE